MVRHGLAPGSYLTGADFGPRWVQCLHPLPLWRCWSRQRLGSRHDLPWNLCLPGGEVTGDLELDGNDVHADQLWMPPDSR